MGRPNRHRSLIDGLRDHPELLRGVDRLLHDLLNGQSDAAKADAANAREAIAAGARAPDDFSLTETQRAGAIYEGGYMARMDRWPTGRLVATEMKRQGREGGTAAVSQWRKKNDYQTLRWSHALLLRLESDDPDPPSPEPSELTPRPAPRTPNERDEYRQLRDEVESRWRRTGQRPFKWPNPEDPTGEPLVIRSPDLWATFLWDYRMRIIPPGKYPPDIK